MESGSGELGRVETPLPLIDLGRVRANAQRVADYCAGHGIAWRPHVKTHKSLQIASVQLAAGAAGLTVATPREAEVMATICDDILLAYPPLGPSKLDRLMALDAEVSLTVGLDSRQALDELAAAAASSGRQVGVLVEIDVGLGRMGVTTPGEAAALAAHASDMEGLHYRGIMFYPGHIRTPSLEQHEALSALGTRLSEVIETLTIIYNDRDMLTMGVCAPEHLAYAVVGTVVSTAVPGQAVLDTGSKALAKESFRSTGGGFGFVLEHPEVLVRSLSEEHGVLDLARTDWAPAVGDQVRVIPNHVCVSVNLQDRYLVDTGSGLEAWPIQARGRTPWRLEPADD
jgi:D-serine deaminase-like pyridoxal phosphate-dependent protein